MRKLAALAMKRKEAMAQRDRLAQEVQHLQEELEASQAQMERAALVRRRRSRIRRIGKQRG